MSDTLTKTGQTKMANSDIDLRLQAAREVMETLGDIATLIGRVRGVVYRLIDEMETLAADPESNPNSDSYPVEGS